MKYYSILAVLVVSILTACGSGKPSPVTNGSNKAPSVTIDGIQESAPGTAVLLAANAVDTDGSISSYKWSIAGDTELSLGDTTKAQLSLTLPNYDADRTLAATVVVTDDKGATTKAIHKITVISNKTTVALTGEVVFGSAVPNAAISFVIGDLSFNTKANAQGQYSFQFHVDNAHAAIPIKVTAKAGTENPNVELVSIVKSVNSLTEQTNTDKKSSVLNITPLSTAEYALITSPMFYGNQAPLSSDDQLQTARSNIDIQRALTRAACLHIIATDSRFGRSAANKNTLDFVRSDKAVGAFEALVSEQDKDLLDNTKRLTIRGSQILGNDQNVPGT